MKTNTSTKNIEIVNAHASEYIPEVVKIFREYQAFLDVDICFKDFEKELENLPGVYAPPTGALRLSLVDGIVAGCVALCPVDVGLCEMKRLYVRPEFRGLGLGRSLTQRILEDARQMNYTRMGLDTLDFLTVAIHLYEAFGFTPAAPYYDEPREGVMYWEIGLAKANL